MIRKEGELGSFLRTYFFWSFPVNISAAVVQEMKHIIKESEIMREDDSKWPSKNKDGMQELAIKIGKDSISFQVSDEL